MTGALKRLRRRTDYAEHGGAPLLGVDGVALICHGGSNAMAIKNAVLRRRSLRPDRACGTELTAAVARHNALWDGAPPAPPSRGGALVIRSRIVGTGRAVPPKMLTNDDLSKMVDTSDSWIVERTGIRERHILEPSLAASDLATEAARKACRAAGVDPSAVDCIIVGTVTGDCPFPATATFVQKKLGATPAAARSTCRRPAPAFSTACRSPTRSSARGQFKQRAGHRRRGAVAHRRLDRSHHLRAVRRRRRRGAADGRRRAACAASCRRTSSPTAR